MFCVKCEGEVIPNPAGGRMARTRKAGKDTTAEKRRRRVPLNLQALQRNTVLTTKKETPIEATLRESGSLIKTITLKKLTVGKSGVSAPKTSNKTTCSKSKPSRKEEQSLMDPNPNIIQESDLSKMGNWKVFEKPANFRQPDIGPKGILSNQFKHDLGDRHFVRRWKAVGDISWTQTRDYFPGLSDLILHSFHCLVFMSSPCPSTNYLQNDYITMFPLESVLELVGSNPHDNLKRLAQFKFMHLSVKPT